MIPVASFDDKLLPIVLGIVALTMLICLLIFYKLTISVDSTHVSFKMGAGLVSRKYLLSDITGCKPVKNNLIYGIGIRLTPDGWLYNVSGRYAVELTFRNKKSRVRIGTDQPDVIAREINNLLSESKTESFSTFPDKSNNYLIVAIVLLVMFMPFVLIFTGKRDIKTTLTETEFIFSGMYGLTIKYSDIKQLDTISILPVIRRRTNGFAAGKILKGSFTLADKTKVRLSIVNGSPPYIFIVTDEVRLYLNFEDPQKTTNLYNELCRLVPAGCQ